VHENLLFHQWRMWVLFPTATKNEEVFRQCISRISRSAGHILVQFLYTGRYSPLRWTGPTDDDMVKAAGLHTAIEVYATARLFKLSRLEYLAKDEITKLAKDLDLFTIIDIVKETYPNVSGNDTWFPTFIKSTMKAALEKPRVPATAATSLDKMLLWGAMEVFRDKLDALTAMTTSAAEQDVSDANLPLVRRRRRRGRRLRWSPLRQLKSLRPFWSLSSQLSRYQLKSNRQRFPWKSPWKSRCQWLSPKGIHGRLLSRYRRR
jgi:hypothetical protein